MLIFQSFSSSQCFILKSISSKTNDFFNYNLVIYITHIDQSVLYIVYYLYFIGLQDLNNEEWRIARKKHQRQFKLYAKIRDQETGKRAMSY